MTNDLKPTSSNNILSGTHFSETFGKGRIPRLFFYIFAILCGLGWLVVSLIAVLIVPVNPYFVIGICSIYLGLCLFHILTVKIENDSIPGWRETYSIITIPSYVFFLMIGEFTVFVYELVFGFDSVDIKMG